VKNKEVESAITIFFMQLKVRKLPIILKYCSR
jgi:hypothetical protein